MSSLPPVRQVRDHVLGVDDLDVVRRLDVAGRHRAFAVLAQAAAATLVAVVQLAARRP
jgi:hypothetical protein